MPSGTSGREEVRAVASFKCSDFRPADGSSESRIRALENALAALTRELGYVLTHLDSANFAQDERERFLSDMDKRIKEAVDYGTAT